MSEQLLQILFEKHFGSKAEKITPLAGSGSNRAYYRLESGNRTAIGVIGENNDENKAFSFITGHMMEKGIPVPEVLEEQDNCYLEKDLGDLALYDVVKEGRTSGNYSEGEIALLKKTLSFLPKIQFETAEGMDWNVCFPDKEFNARMVDFDLNYFKYCFLKVYGVKFDEILLQDDFDSLKTDLLKVGSDTFMYRDFQPRNVMVSGGEPYFIDYQGGRKGPIYYDVASFVYQARARYPESLREELLETYLDALKEYRSVDGRKFRDTLNSFVLFRCLQTLGAYGFRGLVEHKRLFLDIIPESIRNIKSLLPVKYPYLNELLGNLEEPKKEACSPEEKVLEVEVCSFSYKEGIPQNSYGDGGGYVFDCRGVHNPGRYEEYKDLTGRDAPVIEFIESNGEMASFLENIYALSDRHIEKYLSRGFEHLQFCFGCTGGRHRSVYGAEALARHIKGKYPLVKVRLRHIARGIEEVL